MNAANFSIGETLSGRCIVEENKKVEVPSEVEVLIIGGGPAGSVAASLLAQEGVRVVLLEKEKFPRYHIGESLLLSLRTILEFIDADKKVQAHGFVKKYSAYFRVKQGVRAGHVDFRKITKYGFSYQVVRSEFDHLMLNHAREKGALVFEQSEVKEVQFNNGRPISATFHIEEGEERKINFKYLIDASGLRGFLSNKYFKNRRFQEYFNNVALARYWKGAKDYVDDDGNTQPGAFSLEALADGSGWSWSIPLHDGTVSLGMVIHKDTYLKLMSEHKSNEKVYNYCLSLCPDMKRLLENAHTDTDTKLWQDYSYVAESFAGKGYRMIGDAAGFIDPFFSTGVHMGYLGALSAAASICSVLRGEFSEEQAVEFHDRSIRQAYTRFIVNVGGFYKQLRNQDEVVIPGVDAKSFQRAFDLIQPIVSGNMDLNYQAIPKDWLKKSFNYFNEMKQREIGFDKGGFLTRWLIKEHRERLESTGIDSSAAIDGIYIRMEKGKFGLRRMSLWSRIITALKQRLYALAFRQMIKGSNHRLYEGETKEQMEVVSPNIHIGASSRRKAESREEDSQIAFPRI